MMLARWFGVSLLLATAAPTPGPTDPAAASLSWNAFVAAWPTRVQEGRGSAEALAAHARATSEKPPRLESFAICVELAHAAADGWGEAICRLDARVRVGGMKPEDAEHWDAEGGRLAREIAGEDSGINALALNNQATFLRSRGKLPEARALYERSVAASRKALGPDSPDLAAGLRSLGSCQRAQGDTKGAREQILLSQAIVEKTEGKEDPDWARGQFQLGLLATGEGDYAAAIDFLQTALAVFVKAYGAEHPEATATQSAIAGSFVSLGKYAEARTLLEALLAVQTRTLPADSAERSRTISNLASAEMNLGDFRTSRKHFDEVVAIRRRVNGPQSPDLALALMNEGASIGLMGEPAEALPLLEEALSIEEKALGPDHPDVASFLGNVAAVEVELGAYARARLLLERAIALREAKLGPVHPKLASLLGNLGNVFYTEGDYAGARAVWERALAIREKTLGPDHPETGHTLDSLASVRQRLGDLAGAEDYQRRALAIVEKAHGSESRETAAALESLGALLVSKRDLAGARGLFERALAIREKALGAGGVGSTEAMIELANLDWADGRTDAALDRVRAALQIRERTLGREHPRVAQALVAQARILAGGGRGAEALPLLARASAIESRYLDEVLASTSERQKRAALRTVGAASAVMAIAPAVGTPDAARAAFASAIEWKGRSLDELAAERAQRARAPDARALAAAGELDEARRDLARVALSGPDSPGGGLAGDERARRIGALEKKIEALETELARRGAPLPGRRRPTADAVCAALPKGAALVETFEYQRTSAPPAAPESRLLAIVVRGGRCEPVLADLGPVAPISSAIVGWRRQLADDTGKARRGLPFDGAALAMRGKEVRALVWTPLERALGDAATVYLAPDGPLSALPFGALPAADGRGFLVEERTIDLLTSARDLVRRRSPPTAGGSILALGAPAYVTATPSPAARPSAGCSDLSALRWAPLPDTADEAAAVARGKRGTLRTGADASVEAFRRDAPGKRVIHLAVHGYLARCPVSAASGASPVPRGSGPGADLNPLLASGLVLAGSRAGEDGYLTALEVSGMDLSAADLVVLSACETGLGDVERGDGVYGLERAFLLAGARHLVLSLFQVPTVETASLMSRFYAARERGQDPATALRSAQRAQILALQKEGREPHPLFWAGFVSVGR